MNKYFSILNNLREEHRSFNDTILLIDGLNTFIRSFSLIKAINPKGYHIGGLIGFLKSLGYLVRIFDPTRVIVVFDGKGGATNRRNIDPNYKANREFVRITNWEGYDSKKEEKEALEEQLFRLQDYLECLPVHTISLDKLEADDIIAYLAKKASIANKEAIIVSSDKDFLQLIDNKIKVYSPIIKEVYTKENIKEKLGILPENYAIVKALLGDHSDNLKGIKRLGKKSIVKVFPKIIQDPTYNLDELYSECSAQVGKNKVFSYVIDSWDRVETNYKLINLHNTVISSKEEEVIKKELEKPLPELRVGAFLRLLDIDSIESITKNTELWIQVFNSLTLYK